MRAIGISGYASSGKTTVANYIQAVYGYERRHIAEPLRAMLAALLRANGVPTDMITRYLTGDLKDGVVIPEIGKTSRELQITLGTEWGRTHVGQDLWSNTWARAVGPDDKVMNDSVRFPNEEDAIQEKLQGITIIVDRPGTKPAAFKWGAFGRFLFERLGIMWGVHDSERIDRLFPSYVVSNDGSIEDLFAVIDGIMTIEGVQPVKLEGQALAA